MRGQERGALAALVMAVALGQAVSGQAQPSAGYASLPDGADEAASAQRLVLPAPPPAVVTLGPADMTGSIARLDPFPVPAPIADKTNPAALSFDEPDGPVGSTPPAGTAPLVGTGDPLASSGPATPAGAPGPAPVPASPAGPLAAGAAGPLDAAGLASGLVAFVAGTPAGETGAHAAERHAQRVAIAAVYAARSNAPLWIEGGHLTGAARSVLGRLDHAAEDGLDLDRYAVPVPRDTQPDTLMKAELALSEAVVAYARQASGVRVDVARIGLIDFRPAVAEASQVLATVPGAAEAGEALRGFNPPQAGYAALRDKLAELRRSAPTGAQVRIPYGPVLKPGMSDARVPLIRARFGLDVAADDGTLPDIYDTRVAAAVAAFQRSRHMPASGLLTARTVAALSGGNPVALESTILANMELWRWLPRAQAPDRIEVNIPDYQARVLRGGAVAHQTRVVVGEPDKPTPVFAQEMKFIIVNPYWNVPLSILKTEMMPKLAANPNYFADHGYEVVERNGTTYVRQPPGETNALGRIKFMFPNEHSVYLHDTNARSYFERDMRALSHGCVRVDQPFSFAEAVMGRDNGWSEARLRKLVGGNERTINLPKPLPILITYFTAFVDDQTGFQLRDDVYGYAAKVKAALGLQG